MKSFRLWAVGVALAILVGCGGTTDPPTGVPAKAATSAQVKQIIAQQFGVEEDTFRLADPIMGGKLGGNQLDLVDLVRSLEDHFEVTLPDAVLIGSEADSSYQASLTGQQLADLIQAEL